MCEECCQAHIDKVEPAVAATLLVNGLSRPCACKIKKLCELIRLHSKAEMLRSMGITHCPICVGLALLSAVRFMAHAVMAYQLERSNADATTHPANVLGTIFEL